MAERKKILVLGGGLGGMSAAFWLTSTPALREQHEVTVLQQGWRLGGKGASGRNPAHAERIEEHGLHMFMGFYDNAFHTLRRAFEEWERPAGHPWRSIDDAFTPQHLITLQEKVGDRFETWNIVAPPLPGTPGVDDGFGAGGGPAHHVQSALVWLDHALAAVPASHALAPLRRAIEGALRHALSGGIVADILAGVVKNLLWIARGLDRALSSRLPREPLLRRGLYLAELFLAALHGWLVDVLPREGRGVDPWGHLNDRELRDYLVAQGAPRHVANWVVVKALYDLGFAYRGGDASSLDNGQIAAGVGLKILLRIPFGFKGAPLWRMRSGMGDTVFTPLYEVCRQRGVSFRFFHRATRLGLDDSGRHVDAIDVDVQAAPRVPGRSYRPLVQVHGLGCWPSEPLWEQLAPSTPRVNFESPAVTERVRRETWRRGEHFDVVVLGISKAALPSLCGELAARKPRWRAMLDGVPTTATQALQLWTTKTTAELGFLAGHPVMTGYAEPFDSWGDMTEVLATESWPQGPGAPRSVHYFCSPMKDAGVVDPGDHVATLARRYLETRIGHLWPQATTPTNPQALDWSLLVDPENRDGAARLQAQYVRANTEGSERYVQSFPGTIELRLRADNGPRGSDVENLFCAGDWVITGLNAGSAEAAVEGGMLASRAICGLPAKIVDAEGA
jgi:uncharacterized protein with NAD-binding domain and iron-sulfur cluster